MHVYQEQVGSLVHPLLENNMYDSIERLDNKTSTSPSSWFKLPSYHTLPTLSFTTKKKKWFKDQELSRLVALEKAAWDKWSSSGCPQVGPLYDERSSAIENLKGVLTSVLQLPRGPMLTRNSNRIPLIILRY